MKLRRQPEDFIVIEHSTLPVRASGDFAVYELRKTGWTTLDAMERLSRVIGVPRKNMSHAGLKDRHAVTTQRITIRNGPRRSYDDGPIVLEYLGQAGRAIGADDISSNEFSLVLRSLSEQEEQAATLALPEIQQAGVPNYFDDQRFGSWFPERGFIAEAWIRDRYEDALHLTFAEPEPLDDTEEREQKEILRDHWGDWILCKQLLSRSHRRSVVTYLCDHPTDFKGAWGVVNGDLRGLFLSALQSDLWNKIISDRFASHCTADQLMPLKLRTGPVHCPRSLTESQQAHFFSLHEPLPSSRVELTEFSEPDLVELALAKNGWKLNELKVRFPRDRFFSKARRPVMIPVHNCIGVFAPDDLNPGRTRLSLKFQLPKGAYATMIVKRLMLDSDTAFEKLDN